MDIEREARLGHDDKPLAVQVLHLRDVEQESEEESEEEHEEGESERTAESSIAGDVLD